MFILCLLHSFSFANSFYHTKTFFGRRVLHMKLRKNQDKDLFDKFEKYSLEKPAESARRASFLPGPEEKVSPTIKTP